MAIQKNVFGSKSERANFQKLCRAWGDHYRIYHNLPFLNVLNAEHLRECSSIGSLLKRPLTLNQVEVQRLKKTSIDYTLCDAEDSPLVSIEFDGLQQGVSVGASYLPHPVVAQASSPWRQDIMELKLKVAIGSAFPFFVVGSEYFADLSAEVKLTVVDGIIGTVLARRTFEEKLASGPNSDDLQHIESLSAEERDALLEDWAIGLEVESDIAHNPVSRARWDLQREIGVTSWGCHYLSDPALDLISDPLERAKLMNRARLQGARVTLHTRDYGDISATSFLANFAYLRWSGLGLAENIAFILAAVKLKRQRASAR